MSYIFCQVIILLQVFLLLEVVWLKVFVVVTVLDVLLELVEKEFGVWR